jgi:uncharacterized protein (DUF433 family)
VPDRQRKRTKTVAIDDPRDLPAYTVREAAHYLQLPVATLKSWVQGRTYPTRSGRKFFAPVLQLPASDPVRLSFFNLVEAHVLSAFRRDFRIDLKKIRSALRYVRAEFGWQHPLIEQRFETDGAALFVQRLGMLVDASARGQIVMNVIRPYFRRLEFDRDSVVRLYPFTRSTIEDSPRSVFIDPRFCFGRPALSRVHIPTAAIAERYKAGESIDELVEDYRCTREEIEEGLRCELEPTIAA